MNTDIHSNLNTSNLTKSSHEIMIDPPFWWVGMENEELMLLIYAKGIGNSKLFIDYPGVSYYTEKLSNLNYLVAYLKIPNGVLHGLMRLRFKNEDDEFYFDYELKKRDFEKSGCKGFNSSDVIYLLMPDRFSNANPAINNFKDMLDKVNRKKPNRRHGGDLAGIQNHLSYFTDLGITALWITPVQENNNPDYSYHGYAITNHYQIDKRFGTNEDYVNFVKKCHDQGIKVIMDIVLNHFSMFHRFYQDLPSEDWVHPYVQGTHFISSLVDPHSSEIDRSSVIKGWFDKKMVDFKHENTYVSKYLIQNTIWWVEYTQVDGIRLDTQPYSERYFIAEWAQCINRQFPGFSIVGESWVQSPAIVAYWQSGSNNKDGYDSNIGHVMDFALFHAIEETYCKKNSTNPDIWKIYNVLVHDFLYGNPNKNVVMSDNHDYFRMFTYIGKDFRKWKIVMTLLLTTRGIPQIYYGTEILMQGDKTIDDGYLRRDFPGGWQNDKINVFEKKGLGTKQLEAWNFLKRLIHWRKGQNAIKIGKLKHFVPIDNVYFYARYTEIETVVVIINNNAKEYVLNMVRFQEVFEAYTEIINIDSEEKYDSNISTLTLPAMLASIFVLK